MRLGKGQLPLLSYIIVMCWVCEFQTDMFINEFILPIGLAIHKHGKSG